MSLALLSLLACKDPLVAPADLDETSSWFYVEWANEDPLVLELAVQSLADFAAGVDLEANWSERSYVLKPFSREVVEDLVVHDRDPLDTIGVGVLYASTFDVARHADNIPIVDQTPLEPTSPDHYERAFIDGTDPQCFLYEDCELVRAMNDIERKNVLYTVSYDLGKEWRWVALGDGDRALVARSWNVDSAHDGDNVHIWQGYSIDIFVPQGGGSLRYQATWGESYVLDVSDEIINSTVASATDDLFETQDDWITEQDEE